MKRVLVVLSLLVVVLVGCKPSVEDVQKAISETQTAAPTATILPTSTPEPTPTRLPLSEINLEAIAILPGDLPAGYSTGQMSDNPPEMFTDIRSYVNALYQQFEHDGEAAGGVAIMLFDSNGKATAAYDVIVSGFGEPTSGGDQWLENGNLPSPGERASFAILNVNFQISYFSPVKSVDLAYIRCNAVVHIRMSDTTDVDYVVIYGERLDERLIPLVCD